MWMWGKSSPTVLPKAPIFTKGISSVHSLYFHDIQVTCCELIVQQQWWYWLSSYMWNINTGSEEILGHKAQAVRNNQSNIFLSINTMNKRASKKKINLAISWRGQVYILALDSLWWPLFICTVVHPALSQESPGRGRRINLSHWLILTRPHMADRNIFYFNVLKVQESNWEIQTASTPL